MPSLCPLSVSFSVHFAFIYSLLYYFNWVILIVIFTSYCYLVAFGKFSLLPLGKLMDFIIFQIILIIKLRDNTFGSIENIIIIILSSSSKSFNF